MATPRVERSFTEPHVKLTCRCGWSGHDDEIEEWAIEPERDRVIRRCPDCDKPVPEWGALRSIDGVAQIARGQLRESFTEADVSSEH
ncbi:hypothetical protein [Halomontanus rarus]|uniref:hypothetical protein n=1 Tax=Halomontanus rarus TaxID=3034020 RepID=UPI0023E77537|nr:hypothetical protein [Halovivax sp. TS33]